MSGKENNTGVPGKFVWSLNNYSCIILGTNKAKEVVPKDI